jgi:predicted RNA binding protein YcfA (HicA-like mRNA interferase family)
MPEELPVVTVRQAMQALQRDGWYVSRTTGHHILRHPSKPGRVTLSNHPSETLKKRTLKSILTQAGLSASQFRSLL